MVKGRRQGIFWLLTMSCEDYPEQPALHGEMQWIRGQQEVGLGGFIHWQVIVAFKQKASLRVIQRIFPGVHAELTRSDAASEYVWKEDSRVEGTQFEYGSKPIQRNSKVEWDKVWESAIVGDIMAIPANIRVQNYRTLRTIQSDYAKPVGIQRTCNVFWGPTGTGKSRRAWDEAGLDAYPKDPRTKFWCGYSNHVDVVIDEFRGGIDIAHMLRWLDRYPVIVEIKGASVVLKAENIWITSNISPQQWYPEVDCATVDALLRRLVIVEF